MFGSSDDGLAERQVTGNGECSAGFGGYRFCWHVLRLVVCAVAMVGVVGCGEQSGGSEVPGVSSPEIDGEDWVLPELEQGPGEDLVLSEVESASGSGLGLPEVGSSVGEGVGLPDVVVDTGAGCG